jgi:hypothetical protein
MKRRSIILASIVSTSFVCIMAIAQQVQAPYVNIDRYRHGNLAAAQDSIVQAFSHIQDAQRANNSALGGHAQHAKELLSQANEELRLAADIANEHQDEQQDGPPR